MIRLHYARCPAPGNLGDVLSPLILRRLGVPVEWAPAPRAELLSAGSIVRFAQDHHIVWGSGAMWSSPWRMMDRPSPGARYLAVRGPITREVVLRSGGQCPEVYGDPALLLPLVHDEPVEPKYDLGVVPHYIDTETMNDARRLGLPVIHPLSADPLSVVDRIRQCRAIVSSSLHGIVVAHAYGIPAAWLRCRDGTFRGRRRHLNGDGTKFRDHAASVGVELTEYPGIREAEPVGAGAFDPQPLLAALDTVARELAA